MNLRDLNMANFCSECKTENSEKSKFCSSCGTALVITQSKMTSFPDAIKLFFRRCFDFRGRSTRAEYWWAILFLILVSLVLAGIDALIGTFDSELGIGFLGAFGGLVLLIPEISLGVRRLHDINKSGKLILLLLPMYLSFFFPLLDSISLISFGLSLPLLWWAIQPSNKETNKYGPPRL